MLQPGQLAPDVSAISTHGLFFLDERLEIGPLVLYFYPRADTPGCTTQASEFEGWLDDFEAAGVTVAGCSVDPLGAQERFAHKFNLRFPLVADDGTIARAFGVLREGEPLTADRRTFVIDTDRTILRAYADVEAQGHAEAVLKDVRTLLAPS